MKKQVLKSIILVTLCLLSSTANAFTIIGLQDQASRQAKWMDVNGYDQLVARKYVELCIALKSNYCVYGHDWCMSMSLERRWIGISRKSGLQSPVDTYRTTPCKYRGVKYI